MADGGAWADDKFRATRGTEKGGKVGGVGQRVT